MTFSAPRFKELKFLTSIVIYSSFILFLSEQSLAQITEPVIHGTFDGDPIYTVLPSGAIPAITQPEFLIGDEASAQISPDEPVIGIIVNKDARAYSTWHLDAHEIVNDTIGDTPLAVTW